MHGKIKRKFISIILAATLAASPIATVPMRVFAGTGSNGVMKAPEAKKVKAINIANIPTGGKMNVGDEFMFTVILSPSNAYEDYKKVTWSSSDPNVATVASDGKVTAVAPGEVKITATAKNGSTNGDKWAEATITVDVDRPAATSVRLNKSTFAINTNQGATLQATVSPKGADQTVAWSSDNTDVATVDQNGTVTAKASGQATITAVIVDNGLSATCRVFVDVVVIKNTETPTVSRASDPIVVGPVKLQFSSTYHNDQNNWGWWWYMRDKLKLTVVPADNSNIQIQKCVFQLHNGNRSAVVDQTPFEHDGWQNSRGAYGIDQVDVYFTRNN